MDCIEATDKIKNIFIDKHPNKFKLFDGKACDSRMIGAYVTRIGNERYSVNFTGTFSFLDNFIKKIKDNFHNLPKNTDELFHPDYGYQFPSEESIKTFLNYHSCNDDAQCTLRQKIINKSLKEVKEWVNTSLLNICNNPLKKVTFITGKVGSGKTSFINFIEYGFEKKFKKNNILFCRINPEDFNLHNFQKNTVKDTILTKIAYSLLTNNLSKSVAFNLVYNIISLEKLKDIKINSQELKDKAIEIITKILESKKNKFKILVVIDGFDNVNPEEMNKFNLAVDSINDLIHNGFSDIELPISYLLTLRNCTLPNFQLSSDDFNYTIVPPNESKIITKAIKYYIYQKDTTFHKNIEPYLIDFITSILKQIELNLNYLSDIKKDALVHFDYDYRILLDYIHNVMCYSVSEITKGYKGNYNLNDFIKDQTRNNDMEFFLKKKKYIVTDILLLTNKTIYQNPYQCIDNQLKFSKRRKLSEENRETDSFVNNIFNYCIKTNSLYEDSTFPLLYKYRILQILSINDSYLSILEIEAKIKLFGYKVRNNNVLVDELLYSQFIKVSYIGNHKRYKITNKGLFIIDLSLTTAYSQHVIGASLLPSIFMKDGRKLIFQYTPNEEKNKYKAIIIGIKNLYIFLNTIRDIEKQELEQLHNNIDFDIDIEEYQELMISSKILNNINDVLGGIITVWQNNDKHFMDDFNKLIHWLEQCEEKIFYKRKEN